jgi:hypothetical protein
MRVNLRRPAPSFWQSAVFQLVGPLAGLGDNFISIEWCFLLDNVITALPAKD